MRRRIKSLALWVVGIIFLLLGVVGAFLPILQGWFFVVIGLILISLEWPRLDNFMQRILKRNQKADYYYNKFRGWIREKLGYEN